MKTKDIKQTITFHATAEQVYTIYMSSKHHTAFTGSHASIANRVGVGFSCYDGYISGKNIMLQKPTLIVQSWRAIEEHWPENHYSIVRIELEENIDGTTTMNFSHTGVPMPHAKSISEGWKDYYWKPMKAYLTEM